MQLVNFWLVAVSFLVAAFVQARAAHMLAVAVGVSATGALASLAFFMLDLRTRQLVHVAEAALLHCEEMRLAEGQDERTALVRRADAERRSRVQSYKVIIGALQLGVGVLFIAALIYSVVRP